MSEKLQQGEVVKVVADDADEGINAALSYTLVGKSSHFEVITVEDDTGSVRIYSVSEILVKYPVMIVCEWLFLPSVNYRPMLPLSTFVLQHK